MLGKNLGHWNLTACDKFEPNWHNGHVCYSISLSKVVSTKSKSGEKNSLLIVLDQTDQFEHLGEGESMATIHIDTLAGFHDRRPGKYFMSALKKMTSTDAFMALSDSDKKCQLESKQDCKKRTMFDALIKECKCVPFAISRFLKVCRTQIETHGLFTSLNIIKSIRALFHFFLCLFENTP